MEDFGNDRTLRTKEEVLDLISSLDYDDRKDTGHKLSDMLVSCSFMGKRCGPGCVYKIKLIIHRQ